jgi:hypothetical protein
MFAVLLLLSLAGIVIYGLLALISHLALRRWLERFRARHALGLDPGVGTGSREENASKQETRASVPIQSERKRLWKARLERISDGGRLI